MKKIRSAMNSGTILHYLLPQEGNARAVFRKDCEELDDKKAVELFALFSIMAFWRLNTMDPDYYTTRCLLLGKKLVS